MRGSRSEYIGARVIVAHPVAKQVRRRGIDRALPQKMESMLDYISNAPLKILRQVTGGHEGVEVANSPA